MPNEPEKENVVPFTEPTELEIINSGVEREIAMLDGTKETVKIRQVPFRSIGMWGDLARSGDEAALVEFLCGKSDGARAASMELHHKRAVEDQLLIALKNKTTPETIEAMEKALARVRGEIRKAEETISWDDNLTEDSHVLILDIGEKLNRPRFDRWAKRRAASIGRLLESVTKTIQSRKESLVANVARISGKDPSHIYDNYSRPYASLIYRAHEKERAREKIMDLSIACCAFADTEARVNVQNWLREILKPEKLKS